MRTLTISIEHESNALQALKNGFQKTWHNQQYNGEFLTFASASQLFQNITASRWELITLLQKMGKIKKSELATQLNHPIHLQQDIEALTALNIIEEEAALIYIPYQQIHTDFTLFAKAA
ncbi:MAG: HVO_A0114 family putative DNA-binding protein [bacterium]